MCPRDPEVTPNIRLSDDYNITSVVKFPSKYWYFSQVSVKADFHRTIIIRSLEFAFLQSRTCGSELGPQFLSSAGVKVLTCTLVSYEIGMHVWPMGMQSIRRGFDVV